MNRNCKNLIPGNGKPCRNYIRPLNHTEPGFCALSTVFRCIEAMKYKLPAISYKNAMDFIHCKLRYKHSVIDGLSVRPKHLPEPIKLGKAWGHLIQHQHDSKYDYGEKITQLQLSDIQYAKINALMRAYCDLEIQTITQGLIACQLKIHVPVGQHQIIGFVDRAYIDHIAELQLSIRPEFFTKKENVSYRLGTHFMGDENWKYADVQITRVPSLKTGFGKYDNESAQEYEERLYGDILSRPAFYFLGWDRKTRKFGVRFWRGEFDLGEIFTTYVHVNQEIKETIQRESWYANNLACHVPGPCPFLPIKRSGVISDEVYEQKGVAQMSECDR